MNAEPSPPRPGHRRLGACSDAAGPAPPRRPTKTASRAAPCRRSRAARGGPTPRRREAEQRNSQPVVGSPRLSPNATKEERKAASAAQREAQAAERVKARQAMVTGEERYLPAQHRGPAQPVGPRLRGLPLQPRRAACCRSRSWSCSMGLVPRLNVVSFVLVPVLYIYALVVVVNGYFMSRRINRIGIEKFGESARGVGRYARAAQRAAAPLPDAEADGQAGPARRREQWAGGRGRPSIGSGHGVPLPRPQRPQDQRDHLRQLADPRVPGRERRRAARASRRPRRRDHHLRHRRRLRQRRGRDGARRGARRASAGRAWRSSPRSTGRPGPTGPNDSGLSRKHIMESIDGSLRRLQTDYVDLYQAHRYDTETPLEETMQAFADVVRAGKALYIGGQRVDRRADPRRPRAGRRARHPAGLQPAAVLDAVAGHRGRGRADVRGARASSPDRLVADRAGRADRQVPARPAAARGLAGHRREGRRGHDQPLHDRRRARRGCSSCEPVADELGLTMAQLAVAWVLQNDNVAAAIIGASRPEQVHENVKAVGRAARRRSCWRASTRRSATSSSATRAGPRRTRREAPTCLSRGASTVAVGWACCALTRGRAYSSGRRLIGP